MLDALTKIFVAGNALVWIGFGPAFYFAPGVPRGTARHCPHESDRDRGLPRPCTVERRFGIGLIMAAGLWRREWMKLSLLAIVLCTAGLLLGRYDHDKSVAGRVGSIIYLFAAVESAAILGALGLYRMQPNADSNETT